MAAVGLSDLYRYGTRFLGYVLVVAIVGGGLVAAGVFLLSNGEFNGFQADGARALLGVLVGVLGVLLTVSGGVGLVHKLVADAAMTGLVAGRAQVSATEDATAETDTADEETGGESTTGSAAATTDEASPEPDDASADRSEPDTEPIEDTEPPAREPSTAPTEAAQADSTPRSDRNEPATGADRADGPAEPAPEPAADSEPDPHPEPEPEPRPEQETEPGPGPEPKAEAAPDSGAEEAGTEPQEWTPPDPAEFDTGPSDLDEPDGWEAEPVEEPAGTGSDDARTTDDLFGGESADDQSDLFGGESTDEEPDLFGGEADEPAPSDEPADRPTDDQSPAEDETPADEGVDGFEVSGDDDPLSDALDDE